MYARGGGFRSDNMDAQAHLGLTSLSTIMGHFHVTTVMLRFSRIVYFCFPLRFFCHSCLFVMYAFHYALLLWRKLKLYLSFLGTSQLFEVEYSSN